MLRPLKYEIPAQMREAQHIAWVDEIRLIQMTGNVDTTAYFDP